VILISCFGLGLDYIFMALAPTLWWLFAGRVISGITAASYPTAGAYIADVTPPEKRAAGFGMIGAAWGVGFVMGPALGGLLGKVNPRFPFWAAAGLTLLNALYGLFVLPESLAPESRKAFSWRRANPVGSLALLRSHPELLGLSSVNFIYMLAHQVLPSVFVLYAGFRYGWDAPATGLTLTVVGIFNIIVQAGLVNRIVERFGERRALLAGVFFGGGGFSGLRPGADGGSLSGRAADLRVHGAFRACGARLDDAPRRAFGAGAAPGREQQHNRNHGYDRAGTFHPDVRKFHRAASRLAVARSAFPARDTVDGRGSGFSLASHEYAIENKTTGGGSI